jgi:cytochrome c-type biogenesis protein CcmE
MTQSIQADKATYKHVEELMRAPDAYVGKKMQVHGFVEAGSIDEKIVDQQMKRTFYLESKGKRILIRHAGATPDTFKDLAEVVADGTLVKEGDAHVLEAEELMAKCPSKYEENQRTRP